GPCASIAPTGRTATQRERSRSRASSHVKSPSSRTVILGTPSGSESPLRSGVATRPAGVHDAGEAHQITMTTEPPERWNIADAFLDARVREGRGARPAIRSDAGTLTFSQVQEAANRFGHALAGAGVEPEHRVLIALPDGPEFVAALFGTLKLGAVVVMVNPGLPAGEIGTFLEYTRARVVVAHRETAAAFRAAAQGARFAKAVLTVGDPDFDRAVARAQAALETFPSHRDDPAI